jgi:ketosteroid isomerase-like protein
MGHPNEDLLRQGYDAFARGDMDWLGEHFADDIVWHVPGQHQFAGDHRGKDAVFALFAKQMELTGGSFRLDIHDVLANDEHGVALATATATREGQVTRGPAGARVPRARGQGHGVLEPPRKPAGRRRLPVLTVSVP